MKITSIVRVGNKITVDVDVLTEPIFFTLQSIRDLDDFKKRLKESIIWNQSKEQSENDLYNSIKSLEGDTIA